MSPDSWDDAGVYRIGPTLAIAQTVDFITPVVDDPFDYGAIAAANSLSDIYAMGARPTVALSIIGFPAETGDLNVLREIVRGGATKLKEAGVQLLGGHSVRDPEIKFGYAVTGEVHPKRIVSIGGARAGDLLVLTKPIGTGILATALKRGMLAPDPLKIMTAQMKTLNRAAGEAMRGVAHAATDVTGFGLLGHARNMARASRTTLRVWSAAVPFLPGALKLVQDGVASAGLAANREGIGPEVLFQDGVPQPIREALFDPQTSGGLLMSIPASRANAFMKKLKALRIRGVVIGEVRPRGRRPLEVQA